MKSNIFIKGFAFLAVIVLSIVLIQGRSSKQGSGQQVDAGGDGETTELISVETGPAQEDNGISIDPLEDDTLEGEYGVDVDSPVETMRTLTNETRALREESSKLKDKNKQSLQAVDKLLKMEDNIVKRTESRLSRIESDADIKMNQLEKTQKSTMDLLSELKNQLDNLKQGDNRKGGRKTANGYDIGSAGIPSGLGYDDKGNTINFDEIVWTNPIDATVDAKDPTKISLPSFQEVASSQAVSSRPEKQTTKKKSKEERLIKAYTIPSNGTLLGSVSMTAMLGRIPTNGQVVDPYPFKVIVGKENLSSNGIHIPGVTGIKMSGIAKGDWTLSCVSGEITTMTFTFQDGTIVTFPEPGAKSKDSIAWFSDKNGIPCITGRRITNAASYLTQRVGLTAASSYANAEAASQITTSTTTSGGVTSAVTGDPRVVAKNTAISEGLNEVTDWLDDRQESSFDAIYIPPGTELAIHITEQLNIDYDPEGRKVNHYAKVPRYSDRNLD